MNVSYELKYKFYKHLSNENSIIIYCRIQFGTKNSSV